MNASADTLARATAVRLAPRDDAAWHADVIRSVWERQRGAVEDRLALIERATRALAEDQLDAVLRDRAQRAAHMLAGSIGMFGFDDAALAARSLEQGLSRPQRRDAPALAALIERIHSDIA